LRSVCKFVETESGDGPDGAGLSDALLRQRHGSPGQDFGGEGVAVDAFERRGVKDLSVAVAAVASRSRARDRFRLDSSDG
jgi:hypothetical protein